MSQRCHGLRNVPAGGERWEPTRRGSRAVPHRPIDRLRKRIAAYGRCSPRQGMAPLLTRRGGRDCARGAPGPHKRSPAGSVPVADETDVLEEGPVAGCVAEGVQERIGHQVHDETHWFYPAASRAGGDRKSRAQPYPSTQSEQRTGLENNGAPDPEQRNVVTGADHVQERWGIPCAFMDVLARRGRQRVGGAEIVLLAVILALGGFGMQALRQWASAVEVVSLRAPGYRSIPKSHDGGRSAEASV